MRMVLMFLVTMFLSFAALAGFKAETATTNLGLLTTINCGAGMNCSKSGAKLLVANAGFGVMRNRVAATATTLTAAQCGSTFYNSGAVEVDLPDAALVLGCRYTFITMNASNFDIDPDAADQILVQTNAAGDRARNATLGNSITLEAVSASQWAPVSVVGTWADAD